jgi:hypothetical protein
MKKSMVNDSENYWYNTQSITNKHGKSEKYIQARKRVTELKVT